MAKENTVSILGCGWLGLPVAENLIHAGWQVNGSTTTPEKLALLNNSGIHSFLINLAAPTAAQDLVPFLNADYLIISFPPRLRSGNEQNYHNEIQLLRTAISSSGVRFILFISSTGVYPDLNKIITEAEELTPYVVGNRLLQAEEAIFSIPGKSSTILRFGGLVGGTRHPGCFLAGKQQVANPDAPVNLIHLQDCVAIISQIFQQHKWGNIYNACADEHPSREAFYTRAAQQLQVAPPQFAAPAGNETYKIISSEKLKIDLQYHFIYPDPLLFVY